MALLSKVGSIQQPTSNGQQAYTGVGFQPKVILFWATPLTADGNTTGAIGAMGAATSSSDQRYSSYANANGGATANDWNRYDNTKCIGLTNDAGTILGAAALVSMDSDGFTLNWTTTDGTQRVVTYLALGGTDITNVATGQFAQPTTTGAANVTTVGFQPDAVLFFQTASNTASPPSGLNVNSRLRIATGVSSSSRQASGARASHGTTASTVHNQITSAVISVTSGGSTTIIDNADYTGSLSNGFSLNWTVNQAAANIHFFVAIKGCGIKIGVDTQKTSTGTKATTGLGFQPKAIFLVSQNAAASAAVGNDWAFSLGAASGATDRFTIWSGDKNAANPCQTNVLLDRAAVLRMVNAGSSVTTTAVADLSSLDSNGFTLNWTTADGTAREFQYLAFGNTPPPPTSGDLTAYLTNANNAGTLSSTGRDLATTAPASEGTATNKCAKLTGWGELYARGFTGTWPNAGAEPAPSGNGWILDSTFLEAKQISAGNWTPTLKLATSVASGITVSVYCRAYKRSSAGVYTLIARASKTGWALTSTASAQALSTVAVASPVNFETGDKLYIDIQCQITANTGNSNTATINVYENGGSNEAYVTPGWVLPSYSATLALDGKKPTAAVDAEHTFTGSSSVTARKPATAITAEQQFSGAIALDGKRPGIVLAAEQTEPSSVDATAALTAKKPTVSAAAELRFAGGVGIAAGKPTAAANAGLTFSASLPLTGKKASTAIPATLAFSGASGLTGKKPAITTTAELRFVGSVAAAGKRPTLTAAAEETFALTGAVDARKPSVAATADLTFTGSAALDGKRPTFQAAAAQGNGALVTLVGRKPTVDLAADETFSSSAALAGKKPTLAAEAEYTGNGIEGTLGLYGKKPAIALEASATGGDITATGQLTARKPDVLAAAELSFIGDIALAGRKPVVRFLQTAPGTWGDTPGTWNDVTGTWETGTIQPHIPAGTWEDVAGTWGNVEGTWGSSGHLAANLALAGKRPSTQVDATLAFNGILEAAGRKPTVSAEATELIGEGALIILNGKRPSTQVDAELTFAGQANLAGKRASLAAEGSELFGGFAWLIGKKPTVSAAGTNDTAAPPQELSAAIGITARKPATTVVAAEYFTGSATLNGRRPAVSAAAAERFLCNFALAGKRPGASLAGGLTFTGQLVPASKKPRLEAGAAQQFMGSVAVAGKKPVVLLESPFDSSRSAEITLASRKPSLAATAAQTFTADTALTAKRPVLGVAVAETFAAQVNAAGKKPTLSIDLDARTPGAIALTARRPAVHLVGAQTFGCSAALLGKRPRITTAAALRFEITAALAGRRPTFEAESGGKFTASIAMRGNRATGRATAAETFTGREAASGKRPAIALRARTYQACELQLVGKRPSVSAAVAQRFSGSITAAGKKPEVFLVSLPDDSRTASAAIRGKKPTVAIATVETFSGSATATGRAATSRISAREVFASDCALAGKRPAAALGATEQFICQAAIHGKRPALQTGAEQSRSGSIRLAGRRPRVVCGAAEVFAAAPAIAGKRPRFVGQARELFVGPLELTGKRPVLAAESVLGHATDMPLAGRRPSVRIVAAEGFAGTIAARGARPALRALVLTIEGHKGVCALTDQAIEICRAALAVIDQALPSDELLDQATASEACDQVEHSTAIDLDVWPKDHDYEHV